MTTHHEDAPLRIPDTDTANRLRDVFENAGYRSLLPLQLADLKEIDIASADIRARQLAIGLRRTAGMRPVDILTRLFLISVPVMAELVEKAVAPMDLSTWIDHGLLKLTDGKVTACVQLAPALGVLVTADVRKGSQFAANHVMSYSGSTRALNWQMMRKPINSLLDLGTGCGILALKATEIAKTVVGTDINPRAVNLATFNVKLNGMDNVEILQGDFFEPVKERQFDLIISNPPFVISPEKAFLYRDGGRPADELLHFLIQEAPKVLVEGGYCQFSCQWAHIKGENWQERLAGWAKGNGCDVWVLKGGTKNPVMHTESWVVHENLDDCEAWADRMNHWVKHFEQLGLEAVSHGMIFLRKRTQGRPNWFVCDDAPEFSENTGAIIERGFQLRDWLINHSPDEMLNARVKMSREVLWDQSLAPTSEGWEINDSQLSIHGGFNFKGEGNQYVIGLLDRCRGTLTLREALADLAGSTGAELDLGQSIHVLRELIAQSFLLPEGIE